MDLYLGELMFLAHWQPSAIWRRIPVLLQLAQKVQQRSNLTAVLQLLQAPLSTPAWSPHPEFWLNKCNDT